MEINKNTIKDMRRNLTLVSLLILNAIATNQAFANADLTGQTLKDGEVNNIAKEDPIRVQIQLNPEAVALLGPAESATSSSTAQRGAGVGGVVIYGLTEKFGIGSGLRQAFAADSKAQSVFTQLDVRLVFAATGSLMFDPAELKSAPRSKLGGLRFQTYLSQYYFSKEVAPYSGIGVGTSYEIPATKRVNYIIGTRADRISNNSIALYPLQFYGGIGFRL